MARHSILVQVDESIGIEDIKSALNREGINYGEVDILTNEELQLISASLQMMDVMRVII